MNKRECEYKVKTLVIYPNTNGFYRFIGKGLKMKDVEVDGFYSNFACVFMNLQRFLSIFNSSLPKRLIIGEWKKKKAETIILFEEVASKDTIKLLDQNNPNSRKIYYIWNTNVNCEKVEYARRNGWEIWSFDKNECERKKYLYINQFYPMKDIVSEQKKWDVFFCGYDKGRAESIKKLIKVFKQDELSFKIIIREWGIKQYIKAIKSLNRSLVTIFEIDYKKVIQYIEKSRCILDIVKEGQTGYTMRVMEALFYEKKLITNNIRILDADFYKESNFFILGYDDLNALKKWMQIPFDKVGIEKFKKEYSVENWYKNLNVL